MLKSCSQRYVVMILIFFELINCLSNNINKLSLSTSKIKNFVQTANHLFTDITKNRNDFYSNEGINLIVNQFDVEKLKVFLDEFMRCGPNLDVHPTKILHVLNRKTDS